MKIVQLVRSKLYVIVRDDCGEYVQASDMITRECFMRKWAAECCMFRLELDETIRFEGGCELT